MDTIYHKGFTSLHRALYRMSIGLHNVMERIRVVNDPLYELGSNLVGFYITWLTRCLLVQDFLQWFRLNAVEEPDDLPSWHNPLGPLAGFTGFMGGAPAPSITVMEKRDSIVWSEVLYHSSGSSSNYISWRRWTSDSTVGRFWMSLRISLALPWIMKHCYEAWSLTLKHYN